MSSEDMIDVEDMREYVGSSPQGKVVSWSLVVADLCGPPEARNESTITKSVTLVGLSTSTAPTVND